MSTVAIATPDDDENKKNKNLIERPQYIQDMGDADLGALQKYMQPPAIKIIQKSSGQQFKERFKDGDIIVIPQMIKIGDAQTEFTFVPIIGFPTFAGFNPYPMKPFVREMSFDETSDVAKKARAFLKVPCPEQTGKEIVYNQVLNFLGRIEGDFDLPANLPVAFFCRSTAFKAGQILLGLIADRKAKSFVSRFAISSKFNPGGGKGEYYEPVIRNDPQPWVTEEQAKKYQEWNKELAKMVESRTIKLDMEQDAGESDASHESKF